MFNVFNEIEKTSSYFDKKEKAIESNIKYMLSRTQRMFEYKSDDEEIFETLKPNYLELYLQLNGIACVTKVDGKLYCFHGSLGGEPDPYYRPKLFTVANPSLNFSDQLEIGKECVFCYNDSIYQGLYPMFEKYANLLVENEYSIKVASINTRLMALFSASDDNDKKSIDEYIKNLVKGKIASIITKKPFFDDGIKVQPISDGSRANTITQLIELEQYLKASWFNEIGLQSNFNMKRENLIKDEIGANEDSLLPLIDDMLYCRKKMVEKINKLYDVNISVELSSSWKELNESLKNDTSQTNEENIDNNNDVKGDNENEQQEID